jgi:non-homologous end joining protein Ku
LSPKKEEGSRSSRRSSSQRRPNGTEYPAKYKDTYTDEVQKLIEAKAKGQKREAPSPKAAKSNVIDLVAALQESLGNVKKGKKRSAA